MKKLLCALGLCLASLWAVAPAHAADTYTKTRYPVVLVHGIIGFESILGMVEYFYRIPYELERSGARVYTPPVAFLNSNQYRGDQLVAYLKTLNGDKFNLIAHSQGVPTSRWAATVIPHRIASITSVNGVNKGSFFADQVREAIRPGSGLEGLFGVISNSLGYLVTLVDAGQNSGLSCILSGRCSQDVVASLESLTTKGMRDQNAALGWAGVNANACQGTSEDMKVGGYNIKAFSWSGNVTDTTDFYWYDILNFNKIVNQAEDAFFTITGSFSKERSDGMVGVCSSMFGKVLRTDYRMNHADAVNHLFGGTGSLNVPSIYRAHANRLKNLGL